MYLSRQTIARALVFIGAITLAYTTASAQFIEPYQSQDEIDAAVQVAKDSIGADAILIGIATTGEIDLAPVGLPGTVDGFDSEDGSSSVWGYQFTNGDESRDVGVVVINFGILPQVIRTEEGNIYDVQGDELDLSGAFSDSDKFAEQLSANGVYQEFVGDYPDLVADAVVLAWEPDDADLFLPGDFPRNLPLWSIFYNTDAWGDGDSSLVCFTASGTGQTLCFRSSVSSVFSPSYRGTTTSLRLAENPVQSASNGVLSATIVPGVGRTLRTVQLVDLSGRSVAEITLSAQQQGERVVELPVSNLADGHYLLVVSDDIGTAVESVLLQ